MSNNNSNIYFLSDADAKDEHLRSKVIKGLVEKQLIPKFFLTGQCTRRKREISRKFISNIKNDFLHKYKKEPFKHPITNPLI